LFIFEHALSYSIVMPQMLRQEFGKNWHLIFLAQEMFDRMRDKTTAKDLKLIISTSEIRHHQHFFFHFTHFLSHNV
jgi:hypothetical protein